MSRLPSPRASLLIASLLPIVAVNAAYGINLLAGMDGCFPYLEGCQSVSRGVRSGPGLWWFKLLAVPGAAAIVLAWMGVAGMLRGWLPERRPRIALIRALGLVGAAFFAVYAAWLGTEGEVYRWLRRYGVVFYFAGTGLAHLLAAALVWERRDVLHRVRRGALRAYAGAVAVTWGLGVLSAFRRRLAPPEMADLLENVLEWNFSLALSLCFLFLAAVVGGPRRGPQDEAGAQ